MLVDRTACWVWVSEKENRKHSLYLTGKLVSKSAFL